MSKGILLAVLLVVASQMDSAGKGFRGASRSSRPASRPHAASHSASRAPRAMPRNMPAVKARQGGSSSARPRRSGSSYSNNRSRRTPYSSTYRRGNRSYRGSRYSNRNLTANRNIRAMLSRLRSTHASLARLNQPYQGHRVRAMTSIARAIRQLSHGSMGRYGMNISATAGERNRGVQVAGLKTNQASSDTQMRRALRTLQGVGNGLANQSATSSQARARGYVRRAVREIGLGLRTP